MLTRVDMLSENPFYLNIRDARPSDSIIVEKIEGLSPPDVDLFSSDYARDGSFISGRRVPPRNVVFTFLLNPNYKNNESAAGLRRMLYRAFLDPFADSDSLVFLLHDDELPDMILRGYTEKFEGDIFSDNTTVMITVRCPNPYIQSREEESVSGFGPNLIFPYLGSAETGFSLDVSITLPTPKLQVDLNGKIFSLSYDFLAGDTVHIVTVRGSRRIFLTRQTENGPENKDILYALNSGSTWLEIHSPENSLRAYGVSEQSVVATLSELRYHTQYWGI